MKKPSKEMNAFYCSNSYMHPKYGFSFKQHVCVPRCKHNCPVSLYDILENI